MIGLGTLINCGAIIGGGLSGSLIGKLFRKEQQDALTKTCGISVLFIAISGAMQGMLHIDDGTLVSGKSMLVVLCLAAGTIIGELIGIENGFERFGEWLKVKTGNSGDAAWVDEDTAATSGTLSLSNITLAGHELVKAITVSWKLKTMSIDAFLTYITTKIAERMGAAIANAIVSGQGIPGVGDTFKAQPYGIITRLKGETNTPQVVTYTHGGSVAYANITAALGKIKSGYMDGVKIYAKNSDIWNQLANITTTQKQPIFIPDPTGQTIGRLFGREVVEEDAIPTGSFLIGNVRRAYVMNRNQDVSIYTEEHTLARSTDYMGYAILDGDLLTTKAFVLIEEAAS